jgi:YbbR domain-containing protein
MLTTSSGSQQNLNQNSNIDMSLNLSGIQIKT